MDTNVDAWAILQPLCKSALHFILIQNNYGYIRSKKS